MFNIFVNKELQNTESESKIFLTVEEPVTKINKNLEFILTIATCQPFAKNKYRPEARIIRFKFEFNESTTRNNNGIFDNWQVSGVCKGCSSVC